MDKLTKYDKETTITYNNAEPDAEIFTYDRKLITRLKKKNIKFEEINSDGSVLCIIPKTWIRISTPRNISQESRLKLAKKAKIMGKNNGTKA